MDVEPAQRSDVLDIDIVGSARKQTREPYGGTMVASRAVGTEKGFPPGPTCFAWTGDSPEAWRWQRAMGRMLPSRDAGMAPGTTSPQSRVRCLAAVPLAATLASA